MKLCTGAYCPPGYDGCAVVGFNHPPVTVYDTTGAQVTDCVACDTETGEVHQWVTDSLGRIVVKDGFTSKKIGTRPAPLRLVPLSEGE